MGTVEPIGNFKFLDSRLLRLRRSRLARRLASSSSSSLPLLLLLLSLFRLQLYLVNIYVLVKSGNSGKLHYNSIAKIKSAIPQDVKCKNLKKLYLYIIGLIVNAFRFFFLF